MPLAIVGPRWLQEWWPTIVAVLGVLISLVASINVALTKRQTRAAIGWIGLIWVAPYIGTALYVVFGINRVRRRAQSLRRNMHRSDRASNPDLICEPIELREVLGHDHVHLLALARLVGELTGEPLTDNNEIIPLRDGDEAYPAMIRAIEEARHSVTLCTYIFYDDPTGRRFVEALKGAVVRGVEVRVLIDDFGGHYAWPTILGRLREAGIRHATFIPTLSPTGITVFNMRNHRKILIADGQVAFTGGMNIDEAFLHGDTQDVKHHDLHFEVRGPVVSDLQRVFVDDWAFTTHEILRGETWFPTLMPVGRTPARCVFDGPDLYVDRLLTTFTGAVACARLSVAIVTPYFLPDDTLISALNVAALRGVEVDILLPCRTNIRLVQWASMPFLQNVMEGGCRVWLSPPPFDHTKLMIVDHAWAFLGSANLDPRSLRLNFEVNVECYGKSFAERVERIYLEKKQKARPLTLADLASRSFPVKLRDGVARLFSPYL